MKTAPLPEARCELCAFSTKSERELNTWHCHRYPPQMVAVATPQGAQLMAVHPMVQAVGVCGEYEAPTPVIH